MSNRYEGNAFLRLLELYVLWCIDGLDSTHKTTLEEMTPKLQRTYTRAGTWWQIIEAEMEFKPEIRAAIRQVWETNARNAEANGENLLPEDFARMIVDANFR